MTPSSLAPPFHLVWAKAENPFDLPLKRLRSMVIAVYNNKGGVGKTTLAVHLFYYLSFAGKERWAFYDADPQRDGLSWLSGHNAEALEGGVVEFSDSKTRKSMGHTATTNLDVALGFPNIIVDAPPREDFLERLGEHAPPDLIVVPVNGRLAIDGAVHVAENAGAARVVLAFNMTDPKDEFSQAEAAAAKKIGVEVYPYAIPRNDVVRRAELQGVPVWELPHGDRTHAVQALRGFCQWVASGAGKLPTKAETAEGGRKRGDIWDRYNV